MDWIKSPLEVPMPTQRERSPLLFSLRVGRIRVDVASRMKELEATGPVLKAGPIAAFTVVKAPAARAAETSWLTEGMVVVIWRYMIVSSVWTA